MKRENGDTFKYTNNKNKKTPEPALLPELEFLN